MFYNEIYFQKFSIKIRLYEIESEEKRQRKRQKNKLDSYFLNIFYL